MTNTNEIKPLAVSPSDAAKIAGIGRTKLYDEIASSRIRSLKVGKRRLITVEAIKDWLQAREAENASGVGGADER